MSDYIKIEFLRSLTPFEYRKYYHVIIQNNLSLDNFKKLSHDELLDYGLTIYQAKILLDKIKQFRYTF